MLQNGKKQDINNHIFLKFINK